MNGCLRRSAPSPSVRLGLSVGPSQLAPLLIPIRFALAEIESALKSGNRSKLNELSSKFYSLIPHSFGRRVPPVIGSDEQLKNKQDLLNVLNDIEVAQAMQADAKKKAAEAAAEEVDAAALPRNPLDDKYDSLACDLAPLAKSSKEYAVIEKYVAETRSGRPAKVSIDQIFSVNRHGEEKRFKEHDHITNRRLCWHGTSVAVVAAILNSGLRIMPHSGGRVGKGQTTAEATRTRRKIAQCSMRGNVRVRVCAEGHRGARAAVG